MLKFYFTLFSFLVLFSGCTSVDVNVLEVYKKEFGTNSKKKVDPTQTFNNLDLTPIGKYTGNITNGGGISGKVTNSSDIEIAFALISFGKVETGKDVVFNNLKSDAQGNYRIVNLEPGIYRVVSMQVGYGLTVVNDIDLTAPNSSKDVDLVLNKN